jgi:hypothetical protein
MCMINLRVGVCCNGMIIDAAEKGDVESITEMLAPLNTSGVNRDDDFIPGADIDVNERDKGIVYTYSGLFGT